MSVIAVDGGSAPQGGTASTRLGKGPAAPPSPQTAPRTPHQRKGNTSGQEPAANSTGNSPLAAPAPPRLRGKYRAPPLGIAAFRYLNRYRGHLRSPPSRSARPTAEGNTLMPAINGRPVISRADIIARGMGKSTAEGLYRNRAVTGHPEKAGRIGRTDYWYQDEWEAWQASYRQAKRARLTTVDRSGDPGELVNAAGAARILGYANAHVVNANLRLGFFPEPDQVTTLPSGRGRRRWKRATILAWADSRQGPGGGHPAGSPGAPAKPHPYAGDPRLDLVRTWLARGHALTGTTLAAELTAAGYPTREPVAGRILKTARQLDDQD